MGRTTYVLEQAGLGAMSGSLEVKWFELLKERVECRPTPAELNRHPTCM